MTIRTMVMAAMTASCLVAAACDSGPSGPGTIVASVQGDSLGGALIEVRGTGITGFEGLGGTRVYDAAVAGDAAAHRVLLIHPTGGEIRFEIEVEDLAVQDPTITVVSATGVDNLSMLVAEVEARIER